jgi:hypothetical protein
MHLVYPETQNWRFTPSEIADVDKDIFKHFEWKDWSQSQSTRLVVAVQPPWIVSPQDLINFVKCQSVWPILICVYDMLTLAHSISQFPACKGGDSDLKSVFRLWGKVCLSFAVSRLTPITPSADLGSLRPPKLSFVCCFDLPWVGIWTVLTRSATTFLVLFGFR